ncbi:MAG: hypothetical protein R2751_05000 [Bacteroidales bacterium]
MPSVLSGGSPIRLEYPLFNGISGSPSPTVDRDSARRPFETCLSPSGFGHRHVDQDTGLGLHLVMLIMRVHHANVTAGNREQDQGRM